MCPLVATLADLQGYMGFINARGRLLTKINVYPLKGTRGGGQRTNPWDHTTCPELRAEKKADRKSV